jgi:hypothetical protein
MLGPGTIEVPPCGARWMCDTPSPSPLIRITPLVNDRISGPYKGMEGSSRCNRR